MRTNKREFAVKQEVTPGTVESLASSNVLVRIRDGDAIEPDFEAIDLTEVQATSSKRPQLIGRRTLGFRVSYGLRAPASVATAPAVDPMLVAAMFQSRALKQIAIGAITSGPYEDGETVTGSPSGGVGVVFRETANGASELKYFVTSGVLASGDTLTGGSSGATSTASGSPADAGHVYTPTDSDFGAGDSKHHVSAQLLQDGYQWTARGCLADLTMNFRNGHPCIINQHFMGAFSSSGDQALYGLSTYPEQATACPRFLNVSLKFGSYLPTDVVEFTLEFPTNPEAREDANDDSADGVLYADYQRDYPRIRLDPAMVKAATYDYFGTLFGGSTFAMTWKLGATSGQQWEFFADEAQFVSVGAANRRSVATAPLEIVLCGDNNDELVIWQH